MRIRFKTPHRNILFIVLGCVVVFAIMISLFYFVVQGSLNVEKQRAFDANLRAALLQQSLNDLRDRSAQDRKFFELVRELLVADTVAKREALLQQLKTFQFVEPKTKSSTTTTTTTPKRKESNATLRH